MQLVPSTSAAVMVSMLLADVCAGQMVLDPQPRSLRNTIIASLTLGCSQTKASLSHARVKQHFQPGDNCLGSHFNISVHPHSWMLKVLPVLTPDKDKDKGVVGGKGIGCSSAVVQLVRKKCFSSIQGPNQNNK